MPVWTNGVTRVIATPRGIARSDGGAFEITPNLPRGRKRAEALEDVDLFVVADASGDAALYRQRSQPLRVWRRGSGFVACDTAKRTVECIAAPRAGELVAVVSDPEGRALVRGSLEGSSLRFGDPIEIPKALRLTEVDPFFTDQPWAETDDDPEFDACRLSRPAKEGHLLGAVRVASNQHGVALSSTYSGLVAIFAPDTLTPKFALLLPTRRQQFDLYAVALADGAFITVVVDGRHSLHLHLGADGKVIAGRKVFGKDEANGEGHALVLGKRVLVNQGREGGVHQLALADLKPKLFRENVQVAAASSSEDGSTHLVELVGPGGEGREWKVLRDSAARLQVEDCEAPIFDVPAEEPDTSALPKETGPMNLGVLAMSTTPWTVRAGESTVITLTVTNRGGPAQGLWVELGGPAIATGALEAVSASVEGVSVPFSTRAELLAVGIGAAAISPYQKSKPPIPLPLPSVRIELEVRGKTAGSALLTVRVGAAGGSNTGSAMCGRPFEVSG